MAEVLVAVEHVDGELKKVTNELLTAARGIELRAPLEPAPATAAVIAAPTGRRPACHRPSPPDPHPPRP